MNKILLRTFVSLLVLQALYLMGPSSAYAQDMTCEPHTEVVVDIRPGEGSNKINLSAKGLLPAAVLSTEDFDASLFTPEMAHLSDAATAMGCEGAEAVRWTYEDVNNDGLLDIVFFFRIQDLDLTQDSTAAMLMAHGIYGSTMIHIRGMDSVVVKP